MSSWRYRYSSSVQRKTVAFWCLFRMWNEISQYLRLRRRADEEKGSWRDMQPVLFTYMDEREKNPKNTEYSSWRKSIGRGKNSCCTTLSNNQIHFIITVRLIETLEAEPFL